MQVAEHHSQVQEDRDQASSEALNEAKAQFRAATEKFLAFEDGLASEVANLQSEHAVSDDFVIRPHRSSQL